MASELGQLNIPKGTNHKILVTVHRAHENAPDSADATEKTNKLLNAFTAAWALGIPITCRNLTQNVLKNQMRCQRNSPHSLSQRIQNHRKCTGRHSTKTRKKSWTPIHGFACFGNSDKLSETRLKNDELRDPSISQKSQNVSANASRLRPVYCT